MATYTVTVEVFVDAKSPDDAGDKVALMLTAGGLRERVIPVDVFPKTEDSTFEVKDINF